MTRLAVYAATVASLAIFSGSANAAQIDAGLNDPVVIFAYGDSLTAGYGLPATDGFTAKLQAALREKGLNVTVINGGVSGDTSESGLVRFDWSLPKNADAAIVEFGANDAFQGVFPATIKKNLESIVHRLQDKGVEVMLSGMLAPPNMGPVYCNPFNDMYQEIAQDYNVILYPFYLEGVVANPKLNQSDHIHPNAAGVDVIVERIEPTVAQLVDRVLTHRKAHIIHTAE